MSLRPLDAPARAALALVLCLQLAGGTALAQQSVPTATPSGPLTLEQVLELAGVRSETVGIAQAAVRRAEGEQVRAHSSHLPQLSLSGGYDRALASEFKGVFDNVDFGNGSGSGSSDNFSDLPFGRLNTWRLSLAFSQNLYTAGRQKLQEQIAALGTTTANQGLTAARAQLAFDVTQAFYDAALADRLVAIAQATVQQADATLQQVQAGFDAGTQPEFEVLRARVNRDNQQPTVIRQRVNRDVALLRLKQMIDLPADADLRLADALGDQLLAPPLAFASRVTEVERSLVANPAALHSPQSGVVPTPRTVIATAQTAVDQSEAALKLAEAAKKPTLSLNSTYTRLAYPSNGIPAFDRSNWTVGAAFQLPLLTGGRQRGDEIVAKAQVDEARLRLQQVRELADVDTQSSYAELVAARAAWEASSGTVQQASRAYDIADVRYRNGVSTQLELSDARLLLQQAEANRAIAARDLQVARARVALLPDLPLGTAAAAAVARTPATSPAAPQAPVRQTSAGQTNASAQGGQFQTGTR